MNLKLSHETLLTLYLYLYHSEKCDTVLFEEELLWVCTRGDAQLVPPRDEVGDYVPRGG